jgi:hypothetical protein
MLNIQQYRVIYSDDELSIRRRSQPPDAVARVHPGESPDVDSDTGRRYVAAIARLDPAAPIGAGRPGYVGGEVVTLRHSQAATRIAAGVATPA